MKMQGNVQDTGVQSTPEVKQKAMEHPFPKPLSLNDALTIELLTERYEGVDAAFVKFETDTHVILRVPQILRPRPNVWRQS
jgi:hypothetical protein